MNIQSYISSGIIELYVMGLCSPEEEKELEQLRQQHPALHDAIVAYELQLENNMLQNSTLPSAETDERILNKLASLQQAPVVHMHAERPVKKLNWWKTVAAAAVLLLGVSAYYNYTLYKKNNEIAAIPPAEKSTLPLADYEVITNPAITPVGMYGQGSHAICRCTMFWDKKTGKAYIMIHHLPKSNESTDYQLWAEVNGSPVNVGIIDDSIRGRLVEVTNVPNGAVAFKVTLGKSGGEPSPENGDLYLAGKI